jgi:glycosyltransferase involved in cell wall biosynthesis
LIGEATFIAIGGREPDKPDALTDGEIESGKRAGIHFLGHRNDVRDLYAVMDIVVLPSYREGLPRSLIEAAAMGKPLIASDIRGCRQVVSDDENGYLVPARHASQLVRRIRELAESPQLRDRFGASSRRLAEEKFDERDISEIVLSTYLAVSTDRQELRGPR